MSNLVRWPPSWATLLLLPALFLGFTVHELAHALVAYLLGDTSQVERNRLSFNPLRHVSWIGLISFMIFGFGWAKPVWVDHTRFHVKNRPFGTFLVAVSGASANLATSLIAAGGMFLTLVLVAYFEGMPAAEDAYLYLIYPTPGPDLRGLAVALSSYVVMVNLLLGIINLIPLPLFDGFQAIVSLFLAIQTELRREHRLAPESHRAPAPEPHRGPAPESHRGPAPERHGGPVPGAAISPPPATPWSPDDPSARPAQIHFDIGLAYHEEGQWDEAIVRYRQATDQDGNFGLAYYNLGLAYWAKGRLPLAVSAFRAAVQARGDAGVRFKADTQLRHLARAEKDPAWELGPIPPPLDSEAAAQAATAAEAGPQVDAALVRGVWLRLAAGAGAGLTLAISSWVYVTAVTMLAVA